MSLGFDFKNQRRSILVLLIINLCLKLPLLNYLPAYFDEKAFYLEGARSYLTGFTDPNFQHPPMSKEIIALGIKLFGDNSWGWRMPTLFFGILGVLLTYLLAEKLFHNPKISFLAGLFLTFDFLWFVHSRIALPEIFLAVFCLLAVYYFWQFYQGREKKSLVLFAVFLGLGAASKWSALFLLLGILVFVFLDGKLIQLWKKLVVVFFIATVVYLLTYLPYLLQGHSLNHVWERQAKIFHYHTSELARSANGSIPPYFWPLDPFHLYYHPDKPSNRYVIALANPIIFWPALLALGVYFKFLIKRWRSEVGFLVTIFSALYLPWYFVGRYTFFYYLLTTFPILVIILAKGLVDLEELKRVEKRAFLIQKLLITGSALGFILFYPILVALPVSNLYLNILLAYLK